MTGDPPANLPESSALVDALTRAGFTQVGVSRGYVRLAWPGQADPLTGRSVVVPTDPAAPEYTEMMTAAVTDLAYAARVGRLVHLALAAAGVYLDNAPGGPIDPFGLLKAPFP